MNETAPRRFPLWLFASAALNVLLIGVIIGAAAGGVRLASREAPAIERLTAGAAAFRALPEDKRAALRADLRRTFRETRALRAASAEAREAVFDAAIAEPYDAARMRAALERWRIANAAAQAAWQDAVAEAVGDLSPEERRAVVGAFARGRVGPLLQRRDEDDRDAAP